MVVAIPDESRERIRAALRAGRRLDAVRLYRHATGAGLGAAVEFVATFDRQSRSASPDGRRRLRRAGWAFAAFGTLFALWGLSEVVPSVVAETGVVGGRVVAEEQIDGPVAVFRYQVDGQEYTARQRHAVRRHWIGEAVPVVYQLTDPAVASIDSFTDRWFIPTLLAGLGVLFTALGVWWVRRPPAWIDGASS